MMTEQSDFQKQFFAKGTGGTLFTQKEIDDALEIAKAEIMAFAIEASKMAVVMEREACAKIVDKWAESMSSEPEMLEIAKEIRNRIPSQVAQ